MPIMYCREFEGVGRGMLNQPSHALLLMGMYFIPPSQIAIQQNVSGPLAISFLGVYPKNIGNSPKRIIKATLLVITGSKRTSKCTLAGLVHYSTLLDEHYDDYKVFKCLTQKIY